MSKLKYSGAELLVKCLEANDVKFVFGIPGAKIDAVFNALCDSGIKLILCRHEQNAAFMAAAYGRLTGKPGIVLVTSGPGVCNLVTGLLTATTEGDPVIAIGGCVPRNMLLKKSHQNTDNTKILEAATKMSVSVFDVNNIPEIIENAFRTALFPRKGACFISVPQDILFAETEEKELLPHSACFGGRALGKTIIKAAKIIENAKMPVLLLGEEASMPENVQCIRQLIKNHQIPTISTYQGAGVVSRELFSNWVGRVGLFRNQPGDKILDKADVVICVGYNTVEYDPEIWNSLRNKTVIHVDYVAANIHASYQPVIELIGNISDNIKVLNKLMILKISDESKKIAESLNRELVDTVINADFKNVEKGLIHPLQFIREFRSIVTDDDLIMCDIGTVYMWLARYFFVYKPRQILFSNGQQTLGVALPWALSAKLIYPEKTIYSISGDGGFLFSSMELETAVREKLPIIHFIWTDRTYNMVLEQELIKYNRRSGVDFGEIDVKLYAEAFGARGFKVSNILEFKPIVEEAKSLKTPVLIDIPIDYKDNKELFIALKSEVGN